MDTLEREQLARENDRVIPDQSITQGVEIHPGSKRHYGGAYDSRIGGLLSRDLDCWGSDLL